MKNIKRIIITIVVIIVIICVVIFINVKNSINNKEEIKENDVDEDYKRTVGIGLRTVDMEIADLIEGSITFETAHLSENFKKKYKTKYDIFPDADNILKVGSGGFDDEKDLACVDVLWKSENKSEYTFSPETFFFYKYYVDENRNLDDIEFVSRKEIVDENGNILEDFNNGYGEDKAPDFEW